MLTERWFPGRGSIKMLRADEQVLREESMGTSDKYGDQIIWRIIHGPPLCCLLVRKNLEGICMSSIRKEVQSQLPKLWLGCWL